MSSPDRPEPTWLTIFRLLRWDKPAGRLILMLPALWAIVLAARGTPPLLLVGVIVLGTLATSAAGCVVNDLWDRDLDPKVQRTRSRPLAARALSVKVGMGIAIVASVVRGDCRSISTRSPSGSAWQPSPSSCFTRWQNAFFRFHSWS